MKSLQKKSLEKKSDSSNNSGITKLFPIKKNVLWEKKNPFSLIF